MKIDNIKKSVKDVIQNNVKKDIIKPNEDMIKTNKGFTTADIAISVIIIMLFIGIITTLYYNFYITTSSKNRNTMATNYLIDIIEEAKSLKYDDATEEAVQNIITNANIPEGYKVTASLQKYNETEGNKDKIDLIKILKVNVQYSVGDKTEKIEISTLITK